MLYQCPRCAGNFERERNPIRDGEHCECKCSHCEQLLIWDEPVGQTLGGHILSGPPQKCRHTWKLKVTAMVPKWADQAAQMNHGRTAAAKPDSVD
jgi:hypothetical protein